MHKYKFARVLSKLYIRDALKATYPHTAHNFKLGGLIKKVFLLLTFLIQFSTFAETSFSQKEYTANEGHIVIDWKSTSEYPVELYRTDFKQEKKLRVYQGKNTSYYITGLAEGKHYFFLQTQDGNATTIVNVNYPATNIVTASLITGALLFILLCLIIIYGNKKYATSSS